MENMTKKTVILAISLVKSVEFEISRTRGSTTPRKQFFIHVKCKISLSATIFQDYYTYFHVRRFSWILFISNCRFLSRTVVK